MVQAVAAFGASIKSFLVKDTPVVQYTIALLEMIQCTYFIEEWFKRVVAIKV